MPSKVSHPGGGSTLPAAASIRSGGLGGTTADQSLTNLNGIKFPTSNRPGGPVLLNDQGRIDSGLLPSTMRSLSMVFNVETPSKVYTDEVAYFTITTGDIDFQYNVSECDSEGRRVGNVWCYGYRNGEYVKWLETAPSTTQRSTPSVVEWTFTTSGEHRLLVSASIMYNGNRIAVRKILTVTAMSRQMLPPSPIWIDRDISTIDVSANYFSHYLVMPTSVLYQSTSSETNAMTLEVVARRADDVRISLYPFALSAYTSYNYNEHQQILSSTNPKVEWQVSTSINFDTDVIRIVNDDGGPLVIEDTDNRFKPYTTTRFIRARYKTTQGESSWSPVRKLSIKTDAVFEPRLKIVPGSLRITSDTTYNVAFEFAVWYSYTSTFQSNVRITNLRLAIRDQQTTNPILNNPIAVAASYPDRTSTVGAIKVVGTQENSSTQHATGFILKNLDVSKTYLVTVGDSDCVHLLTFADAIKYNRT